MQRIFIPPHNPKICKGCLVETKYSEDQCRECWEAYHFSNGPCFGLVSGGPNQKKHVILSKNVKVNDNIRAATIILTGPKFNNISLKSSDQVILANKPQVEFNTKANVFCCVNNCYIIVFAEVNEINKISDTDLLEIVNPIGHKEIILLKSLFS